MPHKINRIIYLSIYLSLFLLVGCAHVYLPESEMLHTIEQSPYNKANNNCGHKSIKYANYLNARGNDAYVIVGKVNGAVKPHARVVIYKGGKEYLIDPTWINFPSDGFEVKRYSDFTPWAIFEKGITWKDLARYKKIIKLYPQNIPESWMQFSLSKPRKLTTKELEAICKDEIEIKKDVKK